MEAANKPERLPASLRQARILAAFERSGFVSITELAEEFGVSGMTVRRDLTALDKRGLLARTHGGAVPVGVQAVIDSVEPAFDLRRRENADGKMAIARAAAGLIGPSESIGLDVGTSILALAEDIANRRDLRVFTNNLRVAMRLAEGNVTVYTLGGQVRSPEFSLIGPQAAEALSGHFLDRVFIGVSGFDANGFYDYSPEDTEIKRAFIAHAGSVVVLCDASKFGRRALSRIVPLERVDLVVTDAAPPPDLAAALAAAGIETVIAGA
ncbi:DeoR/GlpR transcriptional regulator [Arsenicitalea aurantiaca]|uniref:DeoR/GlpR transcriptional regulator n=2 Tax=Arsenicitalea aurantiaca TaxID=1783274 RepID=A0A433XBJ2_9HYPH|nr:DeoR/GlpR transcriptional regulator [Arsenicitalea aurantiaca]